MIMDWSCNYMHRYFARNRIVIAFDNTTIKLFFKFKYLCDCIRLYIYHIFMFTLCLQKCYSRGGQCSLFSHATRSRNGFYPVFSNCTGIQQGYILGFGLILDLLPYRLHLRIPKAPVRQMRSHLIRHARTQKVSSEWVQF